LSALPRKRTCALHQGMSALCQKRTHALQQLDRDIAKDFGLVVLGRLVPAVTVSICFCTTWSQRRLRQ
jgi:hypothetical protein